MTMMPTRMSEDTLAVASFFAGCGGLDLGFERAGFDVILASDKSEMAAETYRKNHSNVRFLERDIRKLTASEVREAIQGTGHEVDDVDVVIGGPPCQGFSRLNNEQIELNEMEKDRRNTLFEEFLRMVAALEPQLVLMENVRDLMSRQTSDGRQVTDLIVKEFKTIGYNCDYQVLKAEKYGIPQKRRRMFFIGTNRDVPICFPAPTTPSKDSRQTAGEALVNVTDDLPNMTYANTGEEKREQIRNVPPGGYYEDLPDPLKTKEYHCDCDDTDDCPHEPEIVKRYGTYLRRIHPEEPSKTVSTNKFIHPREDRYTTPRELARLQTFPDNFIFEGTKTDVLNQIGNAVPVGLAEKLAERLSKYYPDVREAPRVNPDVYEQLSFDDIS